MELTDAGRIFVQEARSTLFHADALDRPRFPPGARRELGPGRERSSGGPLRVGHAEHEIGRVKYLSATDDEALEAFQLLSRLEGIIPALEPAHAIAKVMELAPARPKDHLMVVNLSGRGDKDVPQVGDILKGRKK